MSHCQSAVICRAVGYVLPTSPTSLIVPRTRTKFGERAFCVSGPTIWNSLPEYIRTIKCTATFKRHLKTHCFKHCFIPAVNLLFYCIDFCIASPIRFVVGLALNIYDDDDSEVHEYENTGSKI